MVGQYFTFVKIEKENVEHQSVLQELSLETSYLGNLAFYNFESDSSDDYW